MTTLAQALNQIEIRASKMKCCDHATAFAKFKASKDFDKYNKKYGNIEADLQQGKFSDDGAVVNRMQAKAPEGWEKTVKHMKKHSEISNPWALAWWEKDQGYTPHAGKDKKK